MRGCGLTSGDEVPDTTLLKFNAGIVKLKEETGLPQIAVVEKLEQLRDADEQDRSRIVGTLRAFKSSSQRRYNVMATQGN